ncbi:unnamed protein product [Parnassius apollo]|uniref:(apollo) hypothetical protein n=1 Tax=Parnassius apollo TaxID=110799 RepID=A0A8S3WGB2_PARAO|nr:unnamed protein product [Parnassius apollo]
MLMLMLNANGLTDRRKELELFINTENIDVALISETRLTPRTHIKFHNYTIYRTDHPSGNSHGGTAVILKNNIKHYPLEVYKTEKIQATSIKIHHKNTEKTLTAIYCPPRPKIEADEFKLFFNKLGPVFFCGGEWNSKHTFWGSRLINPRGIQLYKATPDLNLEFISHGEPTYWPTDHNKVPDLLDFYISKNLGQNYLQIEKCEDLSSDHTPDILNIYKKAIFLKPLPKIYNKHTNLDQYREFIRSNIDLNISLKTNNEIEAGVEKFNSIVHMAANVSTPKNMKSKTKQKEYPRNIIAKASERRKIRGEWHKTRYPFDKSQLNRATKELKDIIKEHENRCVQNHLSQLTSQKYTY